jgi:hypothetical protein
MKPIEPKLHHPNAAENQSKDAKYSELLRPLEASVTRGAHRHVINPQPFTMWPTEFAVLAVPVRLAHK